MSNWDHWINKEHKPYLKEKVYKNIKQNVVYYPDWFDEIETICEKCGKRITHNFLEKRPPCLPCYNHGVWQPTSFDIICNLCKHLQQYPIEMVKYKNDLPVFGDDSFRELNGKIIVSFSLLATTPDLNLDEFREEFLLIKKKLCKTFSPESWVLHMTELWSGEKRKKTDYLHSVNREHVLNLCLDLEKLLKKHSQGIEIFNASAVYYKPKNYSKKDFKLFKERTYYALLMRLFYEGTKLGTSPRLYFETTGDDGWAKNLFLGGRLTMMWPIITHGVPIRSPEFVGKNFDFRMELADFISLTIARYLFIVGSKADGHEIEFDVDPAWLGNVRYLGFKTNGNCMLNSGNSYPLEQFFRGTGWEKI